MQDDRTLTFREIHGSSEALLAAVEEVERTALIESNDTSPFCFRLLEFYPRGGSEYDFILTPTHDYERSALSNYLTVSYVWAHEQPLDGTQIPAYRIWDGTDLHKPPRPLRSPSIVFHRVVQFARSQNIRRIWLDQECINQEDPTDIERHLQDMNRIYQFSRLTVAVLSKAVENWAMAVRCLNLGWTSDEQDFELLTFHEQQCADDVVYLLPIQPSLKSKLTEVAPHVIFCHDAGIDHGMVYYRLTSPTKHDKNDPLLQSYFLRHNQGNWRFENIPGTIDTVYKKIEGRYNRVLSDRIQILANVCGLQWKLKTTLLNNPALSFSTSLLVLVMANTWPDLVARAHQYQELEHYLMEKSIGMLMQEVTRKKYAQDVAALELPLGLGLISDSNV
ncbi:hypothetical protein AG0111_0g11450 [Alternaria gaisen]|uniref:Uncharacterized protein n=1 Tax=Alternaria gaisen TaxID=167740 RepID=A0ACB6F702_9PLEO|nr:hypothetical protein AG0111_0g11450 [Alternaria gaisen]